MNVTNPSKRFARRLVASGAALAWLAGVAPSAFAKPGGEPLILDTQSGIHSGVPGTVLQTGPIGGPGMVQAQPMATLPGYQQQEQPPIIVSPYISYPGSQTTDQYQYGQPQPQTQQQPQRYYRQAPR